MRVLVIGGSGLVGNMITPYLQRDHSLTIFDRQPPADQRLRHIEGDITSYPDLTAAMAGQGAIIYMAMGSLEWDSIHGINTAYDINVKGIHLALKAAHEAGIDQAVYTSSMSVYRDLSARNFADENVPPDAIDLYGFTKGLGEQVCLNATRNWNMHINALRLCFPTPDDTLDQVESAGKLLATAASDVAAAISSALTYRNRFQTFMISGDFQQSMLDMSKARLQLGWAPKPK